ncbi:MAG: CNP1-like family protein [Burkholderiaceae bacterium]
MIPALAVPRPRAALAGATLALLLAAAHFQVAHAAGFDEEFDDDTKPWQEIAVQLPAPPAAENLLPFEVSATATQSFAIDAKSVTVGADGVVRYTLVTTSPAGARNVSYEGIRCATFERKLYAFGHADGSWSRSRRDQWERIVRNAANRQQAVLAKDYFCENLTVAGNAQQMVERIRYQRSLSDMPGQ